MCQHMSGKGIFADLNIYINGFAGGGKTTVLRQGRRRCHTTSGGIACHRIFGPPVHEDGILDAQSSPAATLKRADVLIIDEISSSVPSTSGINSFVAVASPISCCEAPEIMPIQNRRLCGVSSSRVWRLRRLEESECRIPSGVVGSLKKKRRNSKKE